MSCGDVAAYGTFSVHRSVGKVLKRMLREGADVQGQMALTALSPSADRQLFRASAPEHQDRFPFVRLRTRPLDAALRAVKQLGSDGLLKRLQASAEWRLLDAQSRRGPTDMMHFEENRFDLYEETRAFSAAKKHATRARLLGPNIPPRGWSPGISGRVYLWPS